MTDLESKIDFVEYLLSMINKGEPIDFSNAVDYRDAARTSLSAAINALMLQKPVSPIYLDQFNMYGQKYDMYQCGNCHYVVSKTQKYCSECGRRIKWDA